MIFSNNIDANKLIASALEVAMPKACAPCVPVYNAAKMVSNSNYFSNETKEAADALKSVILVGTGFLLLGLFLKTMTK